MSRTNLFVDQPLTFALDLHQVPLDRLMGDLMPLQSQNIALGMIVISRIDKDEDKEIVLYFCNETYPVKGQQFV